MLCPGISKAAETTIDHQTKCQSDFFSVTCIRPTALFCPEGVGVKNFYFNEKMYLTGGGKYNKFEKHLCYQFYEQSFRMTPILFLAIFQVYVWFTVIVLAK